MRELLTAIVDMGQRAAALKGMIVSAPAGTTDLREALYELEAAIHALERAATDAHRAA